MINNSGEHTHTHTLPSVHKKASYIHNQRERERKRNGEQNPRQNILNLQILLHLGGFDAKPQVAFIELQNFDQFP